MALVKAPLSSLDARGKSADTLFYAIWKRLNYCTEYVIPFNPNSSARHTIRGYFTDAGAAYQDHMERFRDIGMIQDGGRCAASPGCTLAPLEMFPSHANLLLRNFPDIRRDPDNNIFK
ncbi:MAG: hypothetical protein V1789_12460 [PVC group bacterium]